MEDPKDSDQPSVIPASQDESQDFYSDAFNPQATLARRLESRQGAVMPVTTTVTAHSVFTVGEDDDGLSQEGMERDDNGREAAETEELLPRQQLITEQPVVYASSSEESVASTVIVGQEHHHRMPPGAARATQAAMNVRGGIYDRRGSDVSSVSGSTTPYPQSTASSGTVSQISESSSSSKSSDRSLGQSLGSTMTSQSPKSVPIMSTGARKTTKQTDIFGDTTERSRMPSDALSRAFLSLQPSQEFQPHVDPSLVDIIPPTPERHSRSLPVPIPSTPTDICPRVSSSALSVIQETQTDAEASQEVEIHDFHRELMKDAVGAHRQKEATVDMESGPSRVREEVFSQELFETPSEHTEEEQQAKPSTQSSSSLSSSNPPSFLSPYPGTQLSLDVPSQLKEHSTKDDGSQKTERRAPYFEKPLAQWEALSAEHLTEQYGMAPVQPLLLASRQKEGQGMAPVQPLLLASRQKEGQVTEGGDQSDVSVVPETVSEGSDVVWDKTVGTSQMESSFVLKLTMSPGDGLQSQLQEESGQPSGTADTETEPNNSSIVASPSQSIIMPSKSMTTDKTEHTDRETSEKRQEEQQQTEEIEGSLELVKDDREEGGHQPSLPDDSVRVPATSVSAPSVTTATAMLSTTALSVYSLQLSSSPIRQAPIVLPRADITTHASVDEHSHAEAARTAPVTSIVTSVPSESVIGVGDGRVTTRLPPRTDLFGASTAVSVEADKEQPSEEQPTTPKATKKVRTIRKVVMEYIEDQFVTDDGTVVSVEHTEHVHDPTYIQEVKLLNVETEEEERAERTEGVASKFRSKKRKRPVTRSETVAKSSSSTPSSRDTTRRKRPRRRRLSDTSAQSSTPSPKKRVVEVSPVRRSPRVSSRNIQIANAGMRVFARWLDGQYYSGEIQEILPQGRFNVLFDDGDHREVSASNLLLLDVLPVGSSVLVLRGASEYDEAVVEGCCSMRAEPGYTVRRQGRVEKYPRSCVVLSALQASNLLSSSSSSPARGQRDRDSSSTTPIPSHSSTSGSSSRRDSIKRGRTSDTDVVQPVKRQLTKKSVSFTPERTSRSGGSKRSLVQPRVRPIFHGLVFVITNSRSVDGSFIKEELIQDITASSGQVVDDLTDPTIDDMSRCLLIASGPCRTLKYLQALACGVPCVSYTFVVDSIKQGRLLSLKQYLLSAGLSYKLNRNVECVEPSRQAMSRILESTRIMVDGDSEFKSNWCKMLGMCGAMIRQKLPSNAAVYSDDEEERRSCWCDCVVSDEQPSASLLQRAEYLGIPVLSVNWAVQCLVNRKKINFGEDERYRYDHKDT